MTVNEIAVKLEECANKRKCEECKHSFYGLHTTTCQDHLIKEMADEFRRMDDDGK